MINAEPGTVVLAWMWLTSNFIAVAAVATLAFATIFYVTQFPWRQYALGRGQVLLFAALLAVFIPQVVLIYVAPTIGAWWVYSPERETLSVLTRFFGHIVAWWAVIVQARILWLRRYRPETSPVRDREGAFTPHRRDTTDANRTTDEGVS